MCDINPGNIPGSHMFLVFRCLREKEMAILRRTERAMVRAMYGAKLMEKRRAKDPMEMLGVKETVVQMEKANG